MKQACIKSGLVNEDIDKSLFFALEPEAANFLKEGNYYIICDLGGGTGDIIIHKVGCNQILEEIRVSCGDDYGSNEIDKKIFEDLIFNIFCYSSFNHLQKKNK